MDFKRAFLPACLLLSLSMPAFTAPPIRVAVNHAPPYRIINGASTGGIYVDIAKDLAAGLGFQIEFVDVPFARALAMMESGEADMMLGPNRTAEREAFMRFLTEAPLPKEDKVFYYLKSEGIVMEYSDLFKLTVSVVRGSNYFEPFNGDTKIRKDENPDHLQCLRKVGGGRTDTTIVPERLGDYLLAQNGIALHKSPYRIEGEPAYFTVSKKSWLHPQAGRVAAALQKLSLAPYFDRYR